MTAPVTVFFDCHSFDTGWQGTTTYLAGVLGSLPTAMARGAPGLDLRLICAARNEENIRRHVDVEFDFAPMRTGFLGRNLIDIPRLLSRTGADLAVSQYVRPFRAPCPTMSVIHDVLFLDYPQSFPWRYRTVRRALFGWSARHSTLVSTVSRYSAERIEAHFGVRTHDIEMIANGVDPAFAAAPKTPRVADAPLRLLEVSRLERRKRHEWGLEALDALADHGIEAELRIIGGGDGPYAEELGAAAAAARRRGRKVELRSGLPFDDLVAAYVSSDIFLFPAEAEGFGIPVIEAAAAGVPAVVSRGGALAEFDGEFSGEMFSPDDRVGFIAALLKVATNIDAYRKQAERERAAVSARHGWSVVADAYVDIIRRFAEAKS